ncbi:sigma factor-like helix-turn-helix DNA-binding protein [Actinokineospora sp. 24-640]
MDGQGTRVRLDARFAALTARQREILVLRLREGLSAEETAVRLGMSATEVRVAQHRALNRLRGVTPR